MRDQQFTPERHVSVYGSHEGKSKRWELSGSEEELKEVLPLAVQHPPEQRVVRVNPYPEVVLGDWHNDILKVELDNCFIRTQAVHVGHMVNNCFDMDGFIIEQSSTKTHKAKSIEGDKTVYKYRTKGFHIIWNRKVTPLECKSIQSWVYMHIKRNWNTIEELDNWLHMQDIKQTDSLRIGFKGKKKPPEPVINMKIKISRLLNFLRTEISF